MEATTAAPTAERDDDNAVEFISGCNNLKLVRTQTTRFQNERGEWQTRPGESYEFQDGVLNLTEDENNEGVLDWIRGHEQNGRLFHEREQAPEPALNAPESSDVIKAITKAAINGDIDSLKTILVAERTTFSRPEVIAALETALEESGEEVPPPPQVPEHELTRVRLEPAVGAGVPRVKAAETEDGEQVAVPAEGGDAEAADPSEGALDTDDGEPQPRSDDATSDAYDEDRAQK